MRKVESSAMPPSARQPDGEVGELGWRSAFVSSGVDGVSSGFSRCGKVAGCA